MSRWNCRITPGSSARSQASGHLTQRLSGNTSRAAVVVFLIGSLGGLPASAWGGEEVSERHRSHVTIAAPSHQPVVGERLSFHGRWFGIPVGHGWIEVKEIVTVEGRQAYHIQVEGRSNDILSTFYPIRDVVHSYLDVETLRPLRFEKSQQEGRYRAEEVVTFNYSAGTATYRSLLNQSVKEIPLPKEFQDLVSALYWLRNQPLAPNQTLSLAIYTDEKIYQTEIQVKRSVILELLKRGTFPCLLVEPKASFKGLLVKRGRIWAYLTADAYRLPVLVKVTTPWGPMSAILDRESIPAALQRKPF